ncbi:MAG: hypothetical protein R8G33_06815 [Gammaproteobacteria bacterium]|nr:hypothetical protein [Gammaproteobacteria bacterium]
MSEESNIDIAENTPDTAYFSISLSKLRNMYLLTFGLYCIYWFYKHWRLQNIYSAPSVMPLARGIFAIFFTHSLTHRIGQSMKNKNTQGSKNLSLFATAFVVLIILTNIFSKLAGSGNYPIYFDFIWIALLYLSVLPLIEIQDNVNALKGDPLGIYNSKYNWQHILIIILGAVLWIGLILGLTAEILGLL